MRVHLKGGVWKNTEDEILKAAVMKYGKTQWGRISSLLVRKSPKQCKARWYEWLDPSIKKTEWSKEEDEKLLHLAKLMPTQWRTIAPIIGRTPAQCLDRYQRLLDEAESRAAGGEDGLGLRGEAGGEGQAALGSSSDTRRLRPGEIDPNPEAKPARPDPVDMDEDEKDMLSEARARLANTQGKKAKRKARERQLEEARKLAALQKRRELRAAGIDVKKRKKHTHMDYNIEIPFEKKPLPGFYDTTDEISRKSGSAESLKGKFLDTIESKTRSEREEDVRKEAKRKRDSRGKRQEGVSFVSASDQKTIGAFAAKEEAEQLSKRKKLVLPTPQVDDSELKTIAKLGQQGELVRDLVGSDNQPSGSLLGDYSGTSTVADARTPRTPAQTNAIMNEVLNQRDMSTQQTPLLGISDPAYESNKSMSSLTRGGTGPYSSVPRTSDVVTPSPFLEPMRTSRDDRNKSTPHVRDELGLNTPVPAHIGITPYKKKMAGRSLREQLAHKLASLPTPKNEFEIVVPEPNKQQPLQNIDSGTSASVEDKADIEQRIAEEARVKTEEELKRRSQCVQKGLPRPNSLSDETIATRADSEMHSQAMALVNKEMRAMIIHDANKYPVPGMPPLRRTESDDSAITEIADTLLRQAHDLIEQEMTSDSAITGNSLGTLKLSAFTEDMWQQAESSIVWLPYIGQAANRSSINDKNWIDKYRHDLDKRRALMSTDAARATKMERKLGVTLGGYQARSKALDAKIDAAFKEFEQVKLETDAFSHLHTSEKASIPSRVERAEEELYKVEFRENRLQLEYKELLHHRDEIAHQLASES